MKGAVDSNRFTEEADKVTITHVHAVRTVKVEMVMTNTRVATQVPKCSESDDSDDDAPLTGLSVNVHELSEAGHGRILDAVAVHRRIQPRTHNAVVNYQGARAASRW